MPRLAEFTSVAGKVWAGNVNWKDRAVRLDMLWVHAVVEVFAWIKFLNWLPFAS